MSSVDLELEINKSDVSVEFEVKKPFEIIKSVFKRGILILLVIAVWEIVPRLGLVDTTFLPPFSQVIAALWQMIISGDLMVHISASMFRASIGYLIAIVLGITSGLAIGWYKLASDVLSPAVEVLRNTAPMALFPLFLLFFGIGEESKVAIVVYACSWPIILNTISGVKNVDPLLIMSARSMGVSNFVLFKKIVIPAAIPTIFTGLRISAAASVLVLIAAEMIGAKAGLGYLIIYAQYSFLIPTMYAGIITTSVIGVLVNYLLVIIERRFTSWKPKIGN